MQAGMADEGYHELFKPIMSKVMKVFRPDAIVMQCDVDSLVGDMLGGFNLSLKGHAACVNLIRSFNQPLLLLGGGGYTINHVASCWCYETTVTVGKEKEIPDNIPHHGYEHYYKDQSYKLHYTATKVVKSSCNTKEHLAKIRTDVLQNMQKLKELNLEAAPSVRLPAGGSIDDSFLYQSKRKRESDDPMERLHRLCCKTGLHNFLRDLGSRPTT